MKPDFQIRHNYGWLSFYDGEEKIATASYIGGCPINSLMNFYTAATRFMYMECAQWEAEERDYSLYVANETIDTIRLSSKVSGEAINNSWWHSQFSKVYQKEEFLAALVKCLEEFDCEKFAEHWVSYGDEDDEGRAVQKEVAAELKESINKIVASYNRHEAN